jgi:hypothetical protein
MDPFNRITATQHVTHAAIVSQGSKNVKFTFRVLLPCQPCYFEVDKTV